MTTPNADLGALIASVRAEHRPFPSFDGTPRNPNALCRKCYEVSPCPTTRVIDALEGQLRTIRKCLMDEGSHEACVEAIDAALPAVPPREGR